MTAAGQKRSAAVFTLKGDFALTTSLAAAISFVGVSLILYFLSTGSVNDSGSGGEATRRVWAAGPAR